MDRGLQGGPRSASGGGLPGWGSRSHSPAAKPPTREARGAGPTVLELLPASICPLRAAGRLGRSPCGP